MSIYERVLEGAARDVEAKRITPLPRSAAVYGGMGSVKRYTEKYACLSWRTGRLIVDERGEGAVYRPVVVDFPMLTCRKCGRRLPASTAHFPHDARYRFNLDPRCRDCEAERQRERRRACKGRSYRN